MSYLKEIRSALADPQYADVSPAHAEALIDALALTMVAEGEIQDVEQTEVTHILEEFDAQTSIDTEAYLDEAISASQQYSGDQEAIRQRAEAIAERLDDATLREEAYYLSGRIAASDIDVVSDETAVLRAFVQAFEIPRQRLKLLTQRMREEV
jgi:hypothetical protein